MVIQVVNQKMLKFAQIVTDLASGKIGLKQAKLVKEADQKTNEKRPKTNQKPTKKRTKKHQE